MLSIGLIIKKKSCHLIYIYIDIRKFDDLDMTYFPHYKMPPKICLLMISVRYYICYSLCKF